jgi:flap endonuclease-1
LPVQEYNYEKVLQGLELNKDEFIDLCILLGCDYCDSIRGIGPKRAIELIRQHKSIENILENIDKTKYTVPEDWNYKKARQLFIEPDVASAEEFDLKWTEPNEEGLVEFLCGERQFREERVRGGAQKLLKSKTSATQGMNFMRFKIESILKHFLSGRLDSFFKVISSSPAIKRKPEENKKNASKKAKGSGGSRRGRKPK